MKRRRFFGAVAALATSPAVAAIAPNMEEPPAASPRGVLADFVAAMPAGTWAPVPPSSGMDAALYSAGTTQNMLIFGGSTFYDPVAKRIPLLGCDHGQPDQFVQYDLATHAWSTVQKPSIGSHAYQHLAVDPATGSIYVTLMGRDDVAGIYRWNGTTFERLCRMPQPALNLIATALAWWNGQLTWYEGSGGTVWLLDVDKLSWRPGGGFPGQRGIYHNVSAPTASGLVFGGGNNFTNNWPADHQLWRLDTDRNVTRMPDAPFRIGIFNGMSLCGDGKGRVNLLGFSQFWRLDPAGSGTMTRLPDPPADLVSPAPAGSLMSCAIDELECTVYLQWDRARTPKAAMHVFKA